ncbi:MAG: 50S ribosomal protein L17 [Candidatus Pelagibacter sp.]|jgi:large subunit ribosomal protein L17|nr:50S ribosomal protein L17 [Candidatus Pelagibacter sp.]|tara:strand:+ start:13144 stop:13590 length:447 start_codon:yes stop_codon:yes gene_type:complete
MRHALHHKKLNRTSEHRKSLIKNMLNSLIKYEQISTTLPKARILKPQIDKIITLGKKDSLANKRNLFSKLQDKINTRKVTNVLSKRYLNRKGGYSRIIKAGFRYGDRAPVAIIELVDRDINAKKIDIKKKTKESKSETAPENTKEIKK